ncbi:MAG: hypothetical protein JXB49_37380 [Bacteroidales bacterium]|nr:hypothetical protein [Bacteroidales bacterium]
MSLNDSDKRDFVHQMINTVDQNKSTLKAKGFDTEPKLKLLKDYGTRADLAETAQQQAQAEALKATQLAKAALDKAYKEASATVELIVGLLGKDHELVQKLKQIRN